MSAEEPVAVSVPVAASAEAVAAPPAAAAPAPTPTPAPAPASPAAVQVQVAVAAKPDSPTMSKEDTPKDRTPTEYLPGKVVSKPTMESHCGCCSRAAQPVPVKPFMGTGKDDKDAPEQPVAPVSIKSVVVVYNPFSGNGKAGREFPVLKAELENAKIAVKELKTERAGHATDLARDTDMSTHDAFIIIGGDGTIHEFVNGYVKRGEAKNAGGTNPLAPPIGFVAGGTGNSIMVSLGRLDTKVAAQNIIAGRITKLDMARVTSDDPKKTMYWLNLIGWGLGVDANFTAEACRCCGPARYNFGGCWNVCKNKWRPITLDVDGFKRDLVLDTIFLQNNSYGGSHLRLAPYAKLNDGLLDLVLVHHRCCCPVLAMFEELKREGSHVYDPSVEYYRFKTLKMSVPDTQYINVDGENTAPAKAWTIEVVPRALPLLFTPD